MKQKQYIYILIFLSLLILPFKGSFRYFSVYAVQYEKVSEGEYKEFLSKFLEEKYYINSDKKDSGGICNVGKVYAECKGVTVSSTGKTYDLDTYISGVLDAEPGYTIEGNDELGKAWAIIIRSYTLAHTNNCTNSITASSNEQNFTDGSKKYKKYADETSGIVMTDNNEILEAVYSLATASDCVSVSGKCKFQRCTKYAESISSCPGEVTEFIVPSDTITYSNYDVHYGGIEPFIARYLANNENYTYDKLLKAFYGKNISLSKLTEESSSKSTTNSSSSDNSIKTSCNDDTGDMVEVEGVSFPQKNYDTISGKTSISELQNNEYFANAGSNISQCPWYAKARALEIVNTSTLSDDLKQKATAIINQTSGNGVDWYGGINSTLGSYFAYSSDITKPKSGSIIAWSGGNGHNYGHVGIIEKVNDDGTVVLSDGWNGGGWYATDSWENVTVHTRTVTIDDLQTYDGYHAFEGYTYLFSYRK